MSEIAGKKWYKRISLGISWIYPPTQDSSGKWRFRLGFSAKIIIIFQQLHDFPEIYRGFPFQNATFWGKSVVWGRELIWPDIEYTPEKLTWQWKIHHFEDAFSIFEEWRFSNVIYFSGVKGVNLTCCWLWPVARWIRFSACFLLRQTFSPSTHGTKTEDMRLVAKN